MDPNEVLRDIREMSEAIELGNLSSKALEDAALELCEKFEALDEWLRKGGFLPDNWQSQARNVHERIDAIEREQVLERAREHTYRPYDTSSQERA